LLVGWLLSIQISAKKHGIFHFDPSQVGDDRPSMRDCERAVIHEVIQQGYLWIFLVPEMMNYEDGFTTLL